MEDRRRQLKFTDYTNQKFFRLTAQWPVGRKNYRVVWLWLCECGGYDIAAANSVKSGHIKSCGCWNEESRSIRAITHGLCKANSGPLYSMYRNAKNRAKKFGVPFDLDFSDISIPTHCPVLGIELVVGEGRAVDSSPSLDRVVPELGYVKGNVHVISHRANTIKNNATPEELMKVAEYFKKERTSNHEVHYRSIIKKLMMQVDEERQRRVELIKAYSGAKPFSIKEPTADDVERRIQELL